MCVEQWRKKNMNPAEKSYYTVDKKIPKSSREERMSQGKAGDKDGIKLSSSQH